MKDRHPKGKPPCLSLNDARPLRCSVGSATPELSSLIAIVPAIEQSSPRSKPNSTAEKSSTPCPQRRLIDYDKVARLRRAGLGYREIAERLGCSVGTAWYVCNETARAAKLAKGALYMRIRRNELANRREPLEESSPLNTAPGVEHNAFPETRP